MKAPTAPSRGELAFAGLIFAAFLTINLFTAARNPIIWQDEVMFADPAVNLYQGHGFTSTAWGQPRESFFAGNSPLYSMLLYPWITAFGFGVASVRSLNYVLILGVVAVSGSALRRLGQVGTARGRMLFAALVLCGDGVTFSYRSGRYDCLGMAIVAGLFAALSIERPRLRFAALALLASLIPWAGLQLVPYTAVLGVALLVVRGRRSIPDLAAVVVGGMLGGASLAALFKVQGVWPEFLDSVRLFAGARRTILERLGGLPAAPLVEPSAILLLAALSLLWLASLPRREIRLRSAASVGLLLGLGVPCAMAFAGRYARYYSWMAFIPMAAALAVQIEKVPTGRLVRAAALSLAFLACAAGLPVRLFVTCVEWDLRDDRSVDRFVASHLRKTDWVFSVYESYYAAKQSAEAVLLPFYIGQLSLPGSIAEPITRAERDRVDVVITKPDAEERTLRYFGGEWRRVARYEPDSSGRSSLAARTGFGGSPYTLSIHRRVPAPVVGVADRNAAPGRSRALGPSDAPSNE